MNDYFTKKATAIFPEIDNKGLCQLLYNVAISVDNKTWCLEKNHFPFSPGETYRTARAILDTTKMVFPENSNAGKLIDEMYLEVTNLRHKA